MNEAEVRTTDLPQEFTTTTWAMAWRGAAGAAFGFVGWNFIELGLRPALFLGYGFFALFCLSTFGCAAQLRSLVLMTQQGLTRRSWNNGHLNFEWTAVSSWHINDRWDEPVVYFLFADRPRRRVMPIEVQRPGFDAFVALLRQVIGEKGTATPTL